LNDQGIAAVTGGGWTRTIVRQLLLSEVYIGTAVYNRRSSRLDHRSFAVPEDQWVRKPKAFQPLIDQATFNKAQSVRHNRRVNRLSDAELLDRLRQLLAEQGRLCSRMIMA